LGSEQFDETTAEVVETIRLTNMLVERDTQELGDDVDAIDAAMETVADRDVDQTVFGRERNSGFGTNFREGIKASAAATTENQGDDLPHIGQDHKKNLSARCVDEQEQIILTTVAQMS
jgi:hypothetical protein